MSKSNHPIVVITGATSGLGQLAALELAKRGMQLVLTARSRERAAATHKLIVETVPSAQIQFFYGDLSSMQDVQRIGQEIGTAFPKIDVLLNNAGLHAFEPRTTSEGLPEMMAVNYLSPWLLTHTLLTSLRNAGNARIVNVASEASRRHGTLTLPDDLTDTSPFTARGSSPIYGKTKLLNIMFTAELARRCAGSGISTNALNPGFNVTGLGRELRFASVLERILNALRIGDPRRGTDMMVRLVTEPKYGQVTGGYFNVGTGKEIHAVAPARDVALQQQLWRDTETLLAERGYLK
ncbi:SDR family NAD(P)-dependent oxidoreductase [Paenibacillus sp. JJ-223]|uniref:SDR family NAD(P)-dependent oxidoreductase n=1 Tax=Paenibacillus sp. JJ-223 TaxID=2905647 RepID=UPI001F2FB955|nr:SDR family NAD(P)-dependent oxidoreductase [Paenibacillus sp. JJ-223]CAH1205249.1 3-oxoacyl-[acyl-carrier-protein] reductase FabG [Paenibacillus sp. JJ-223]